MFFVRCAFSGIQEKKIYASSLSWSTKNLCWLRGVAFVLFVDLYLQ